MKRSLISYTPRVKPMNYSALKNRLGCQSITGTAQYATLPFILFCVAAGSSATPAPRTVSYADGPDNPDVIETEKHSTRWAAWQADAGIRVGKFSSITPPANGAGFQSTLFPLAQTTHLSLAFNRNGWMHIAIELDNGFIKLRRFVSAEGAIDERVWEGRSPILYNNWLNYHNEEDQDGHDVVVFYLRDEHKDSLFARFARDNFGVEYEIHSGLPAEIEYLVSTDRQTTLQVLLGRTTLGDDITMTSDIYGTFARNQATLDLSLVSGDYFDRAVIETPVDADNGAILTLSLTSGTLLGVEESNLSAEKESATLTVSLVQGQYASA